MLGEVLLVAGPHRWWHVPLSTTLLQYNGSRSQHHSGSTPTLDASQQGGLMLARHAVSSSSLLLQSAQHNHGLMLEVLLFAPLHMLNPRRLRQGHSQTAGWSP